MLGSKFVKTNIIATYKLFIKNIGRVPLWVYKKCMTWNSICFTSTSKVIQNTKICLQFYSKYKSYIQVDTKKIVHQNIISDHTDILSSNYV